MAVYCMLWQCTVCYGSVLHVRAVYLCLGGVVYVMAVYCVLWQCTVCCGSVLCVRAVHCMLGQCTVF